MREAERISQVVENHCFSGGGGGRGCLATVAQWIIAQLNLDQFQVSLVEYTLDTKYSLIQTTGDLWLFCISSQLINSHVHSVPS